MDLKEQKEKAKNLLDYSAWKQANNLSSQGAPCAQSAPYEEVQLLK